MSDTPRTNEFGGKWLGGEKHSHLECAELYTLARQLERELTEARERIEVLEADAKRSEIGRAASSMDLHQRRGLFESPEYWREVCRLYHVRMSPEDCENMTRLRSYIEGGLLVAVRPGVNVDDANRYRWLRNRVGAERAPHIGSMFKLPLVELVNKDVNLLKGSVAEHFDNAIDAARAALEGK